MTASKIPAHDYNPYSINNFEQLTVKDLKNLTQKIEAYQEAREREVIEAIKTYNLPVLKEYEHFNNVQGLWGYRTAPFSFNETSAQEIEVFEYLLDKEPETSSAHGPGKNEILEKFFARALRNVRNQNLEAAGGSKELDYLLQKYPILHNYWPDMIEHINVFNYEHIKKNYWPQISPIAFVQQYNFNYAQDGGNDAELEKTYEIFKPFFEKNKSFTEDFLATCFYLSKPALFDKVLKETNHHNLLELLTNWSYPSGALNIQYKKVFSLHVRESREPLYQYLMENKEVVSKFIANFVVVKPSRVEALFDFYKNDTKLTKELLVSLRQWCEKGYLEPAHKAIYEKYTLELQLEQKIKPPLLSKSPIASTLLTSSKVSKI